MAKVASNPTQNIYALLSDEPVSVAPKKKEESKPQTPAQRAAARAAQPKKQPVKKAAPKKSAPSEAAPLDDGFSAVRKTKKKPELKTKSLVANKRNQRRQKDGKPQQEGRKDRQSAGKISRNPPAKKGGAGKGGWGKTTPVAGEGVKDALADTEPTVESPVEAEAETKEGTEAAPETPEVEEEKTRGFDEYLQARAAQEKALRAKIGGEAPASTSTSTTPQAAPKSKKTAAAPVAPASRKGTKAVNPADFFNIKSAPIGDRRDRAERGDRPRGGPRGGPRKPGQGQGQAQGQGQGQAPRSGRPAGQGQQGRNPQGGRGGRGGRGGAPKKAVNLTSKDQFPAL